MTLFPTFKIGLWNLWLPSLGFYLIFGLLLWAFPREVVRRLYDRSHWIPEQRRRSLLPKLFGLATLTLSIFIPIRPDLPSFWTGRADPVDDRVRAFPHRCKCRAFAREF